MGNLLCADLGQHPINCEGLMRFALCPVRVGRFRFDLVECLHDLHVEFTPSAHVAVSATHSETIDRRVKLFKAIGGARVIGQHGYSELSGGKADTRATACDEHKMMDAAVFLDQPMFTQRITHETYCYAQHDRNH